MAYQDLIAGPGDIPRLLQMGGKFHRASKMPFGFDEGAVGGLLGRMMAADEAIVLATSNGLIGGVLSAAHCDPAWIMAVELFWWAEDRQGLRLLRGFEEWAADMGANEVRMTTLHTIPASASIVTRRGYAPAETSYTKVI